MVTLTESYSSENNITIFFKISNIKSIKPQKDTMIAYRQLHATHIMNMVKTILIILLNAIVIKQYVQL